MVQFNDLSISQDSSLLSIDASIIDESYYTNVYIDKVIIDSDKTYTPTGYSSSPVYSSTLEGNSKNVKLSLTGLDILGGIENRLFFVYIVTKGSPSPDTPCDKDNISTLGVIANMYPFYKNSIQVMKQLNLECSIPKEFIDSILRQKAIELAIRTGHYQEAINYWNEFPMNNILTKKGCKCDENSN